MSSARPNDEAIFHAARDIPDPERRREYVREACGGDLALIGHIEAMLAAADTPDSLLDRPQEGDLAATIAHSTTTAVGSVIGPYKLLQKLGEGGMGQVFMAQQSEPVKRVVAVKVIKAGMDSKAVLARFEAERQALAMMDHPNIAKVLDAGATVGGRPFFVMELIKGVPITQYCDDCKLTPRQRLELFVPVCQAIQHAHQKGVIHRDIKPSNVLIAMFDDRAVPKVIDFGVAKATGQTLTEKTLNTGLGDVVGTAEYMSPEQASLNNLDIDTRSDVYSLGVLLYELLTGSTPVDRKSLGKAAILEVLRIVREVEAPRPSHRLSTADGLPSVAANRGTEPARLTKLMKGELDWVVLKALEKDRTRRYETANALSRDIQRYLADEMVEARPPSAGYRLKKFVRRNKAQVIAASLVFLALLAGVIGTSLALIEANRAAVAERKAKDVAESKRREAETNLAYARKGNEILGSVFAGLDPKRQYATIADLRNALKDNLTKAVKELEGSAIGDPLTVAEMQNTLGLALQGLGDPAQSINLLEKARETTKSTLGADHPLTLTTLANLAVGYRDAGKLDLSLPLFKDAYERMKVALGPDHPETLKSMNNLASGYRDAGKLSQALPLLEETFKLKKAKLGPNHPGTLLSMNNLAEAYRAAGALDRALPLYQETLAQTKAKLGVDHPQTLVSMNNLAEAYRDAGQLDQALPLHLETFKLMKAKLGPKHPITLASMCNLGETYRDAGKLDEALPLFIETFDLRKAKLGFDHPETLISMSNLASGYREAGKLDLALPLSEEVYKLSRAKLGPDHIDTLINLKNLALTYQAVGKLDLAIPLFEESLMRMKATLGPDHPDTLASMKNLGTAYCVAKQGGKAAALLQEYVAVKRKRDGNDGARFSGVLARVALDLLKCDQFALAEEMLRESLSIRVKHEPDDWVTFNTKSVLGGALLGQKKYAEAEQLLLAGYEGMKEREAKIRAQDKIRLTEAIERLVRLYEATAQNAQADAWRKQLEVRRAEEQKTVKPKEQEK